MYLCSMVNTKIRSEFEFSSMTTIRRNQHMAKRVIDEKRLKDVCFFLLVMFLLWMLLLLSSSSSSSLRNLTRTQSIDTCSLLEVFWLSFVIMHVVLLVLFLYSIFLGINVAHASEKACLSPTGNTADRFTCSKAE